MEMASPAVAEEGRQRQEPGAGGSTSRLRRVSDPVLLVVLLLPQLVWVGLVVYLLHRGG
jgi:hypothetical protein